MELYKKIHVVFMLAYSISVLQPMDQGVVLTFKFYYLRNAIDQSTAAIDSDSSDGHFQFQVETEKPVEKIHHSKWH